MSRDEVLARLGRLDARDRAWLLGELAPELRRELMGALTDEAPDTSSPGPQAAAEVAPARSWDQLAPERVADALDREPVWLVSSATRSAEPQWRERLLQAMTSRRRHEIEIADRTGRPLAARAARIVLAGVCERIASGTLRAAAPRSKFAALVEQMKGRFA